MEAPDGSAAVNGPAAGRGLRIRRHRAGAGLAWVQRGLRLFARQPLVLVVLVGVGPLLLLTLKVVPVLGDLVSFILTPAIGVGMLTVCRTASTGSTPGISSYLLALRDPVARLRLLQLGAYYALFAGLMALALSLVPAPPAAAGADAQGQAATAVTPAPALPPVSPPADSAAAPAAPPAVQQPAAKGLPAAPDITVNAIPVPVFIVLAVITVPFLMTIWFAPALCGWYRMPAPKALFFSFFACWRNRAAMLVYLVTLLGIWVIAVLILGSLIDLLNAKEGLAPYLLVAPLLFLTLAIAQAANLAMVEDVIDDGSEPEETVPDTTGLPPT